MHIEAIKLTDVDLLRRACEATMHGQQSRVSLARMYRAEHSPVRTQIFWVDMYGIFSFVSGHLVRHKIGVEHFVRSHREDRGGDGTEGRRSPVNHSMLVNAQSLIDISHERLCRQAHVDTRRVWLAVRRAVARVDPDLARCMVPKCVYRNGHCPELRPCKEGVQDAVVDVAAAAVWEEWPIVRGRGKPGLRAGGGATTMPTKIWKKFDDVCDICGDDNVIVHTRLDNNMAKQGWAYDGDSLYCLSCGAKGVWHVMGEDEACSDWGLDQ